MTDTSDRVPIRWTAIEALTDQKFSRRLVIASTRPPLKLVEWGVLFAVLFRIRMQPHALIFSPAHAYFFSPPRSLPCN